jgi:glucose-1-phosphate thymidylyltransferase
MKGVLICGGTGSRLRPLTDITNKSLLPVYDRPLISCPLQTLLDAGIKDIVVVTGPEHMEQITAFLGDGKKFGCTFHFRTQEKPGGIAQALSLAEQHCLGENVCAILGDNVYADDLTPAIKNFKKGAHVFLKEVEDPERFGVAEVGHGTWDMGHGKTKILSIEEKPQSPKSNLAVTGCYLYDHRCFDVIKHLKPSARGELEITDVSRWYLDQGELTATLLKKDWIDAGTFESLYRAATLIKERC